MLDPVAYRRAEALARQFAPSWRTEQMHHPYVFAHAGFPIRVESLQDLRQLTDTMQEDRFDAYMQELGGLSDADAWRFVLALRSYAYWFAGTFHAISVRLPLSTMLAHFALWTKIRAWPRHKTILEIGPGCGYLAFFLEEFEHYMQIETTESFYLMQALINDHCFTSRRVVELGGIVDTGFASDIAVPDASNATVTVSEPAPVSHVPWWAAARVREQFDIITSNANLNEFTPDAFKMYAALMARCLKPDGALIVQCFGGGPNDPNAIIAHLNSLGLKTAFVTNGGHAPGGKFFVLPNGLLVKDGCPTNEASIYAIGAAPRRVYTAAEIGDMVTRALGGASTFETISGAKAIA